MLIDLLNILFKNPIFIKYGLFGLFLNSIFASFIPVPVVVTSAALLFDGEDASIVLIVMIVGAISGGVLSYVIGYDGKKLYRLLRKIHKDEYFEKNFTWLNKYGWIIIFISNFIPVLTEIVTIIAGVKKYNFKRFMISMSMARIIHSFIAVYFANVFIQYFNHLKL